jgi:hypothetical protein
VLAVSRYEARATQFSITIAILDIVHHPACLLFKTRRFGERFISPSEPKCMALALALVLARGSVHACDGYTRITVPWTQILAEVRGAHTGGRA